MLAPFATGLLMAASCLHVAVLVLQEKDVAFREREQALFAHERVCQNGDMLARIGRFHACDQIHEVRYRSLPTSGKPRQT